MITFAIPSDLPALRALWRECFGDPEAYIDFYFQNRFRCDQTLVWREGGAPVAMLSLLPVSVICGGTACPARYIYAVATGKSFETIEQEFAGHGYGDFKQAVGESVVELLRPIREETERLLADKSYLESVYRAGAEKAAYVANRTLSKVYKKVGFLAR